MWQHDFWRRKRCVLLQRPENRIINGAAPILVGRELETAETRKHAFSRKRCLGITAPQQKTENGIRNGAAPFLEERPPSTTAAQQSPENRISFSEKDAFNQRGKKDKKIKEDNNYSA